MDRQYFRCKLINERISYLKKGISKIIPKPKTNTKIEKFLIFPSQKPESRKKSDNFDFFIPKHGKKS